MHKLKRRLKKGLDWNISKLRNSELSLLRCRCNGLPDLIPNFQYSCLWNKKYRNCRLNIYMRCLIVDLTLLVQDFFKQDVSRDFGLLWHFWRPSWNLNVDIARPKRKFSANVESWMCIDAVSTECSRVSDMVNIKVQRPRRWATTN